ALVLFDRRSTPAPERHPKSSRRLLTTIRIVKSGVQARCPPRRASGSLFEFVDRVPRFHGNGVADAFDVVRQLSTDAHRRLLRRLGPAELRASVRQRALLRLATAGAHRGEIARGRRQRSHRWILALDAADDRGSALARRIADPGVDGAWRARAARCEA